MGDTLRKLVHDIIIKAWPVIENPHAKFWETKYHLGTRVRDSDWWCDMEGVTKGRRTWHEIVEDTCSLGLNKVGGVMSQHLDHSFQGCLFLCHCEHCGCDSSRTSPDHSVLLFFVCVCVPKVLLSCLYFWQPIPWKALVCCGLSRYSHICRWWKNNICDNRK